MTRLHDRPHALYRFFSDSGELLYVGISLNPSARWSNHRQTKEWWHEVADISLEVHPDRDAVLAAEAEAIKTERPRYNVVHNDRHDAGEVRAHYGWTCWHCEEDVSDGEGIVYIDAADFHERRECISGGSLASLVSHPLVAWGAAHHGCIPDDEVVMYGIDVDKLRSPADLLAQTAHLMGKTWIDDTTWASLMRQAAGVAS